MLGKKYSNNSVSNFNFRFFDCNIKFENLKIIKNHLEFLNYKIRVYIYHVYLRINLNYYLNASS
jgi:hypothetical protein